MTVTGEGDTFEAFLRRIAVDYETVTLGVLPGDGYVQIDVVERRGRGRSPVSHFFRVVENDVAPKVTITG